jgi:hypothetical protein
MPNVFKTESLQCDILIAGGGPAGVPAAIAAARAGADVILCHDRPMFGGNASSEVRMHVVGANFGRSVDDPNLEARESGIIEEIRLENAVRNAQRSPSMFDLILYEKCRAEPNLRFFLNTSVQEVEMEGQTIRKAYAVRASTEDRFEISAKVFIDCTGDGGLGAAAGAEFVRGREAKSEYGESLAQEVADSKSLGSTILFMGRKHDQPMPFIAPPWARKFIKEDLLKRLEFGNPYAEHYEYGYWWLEWGGQLDTIKDNEAIRDELLSIVMGVWDFIKNAGDHGAANWALDWFGFVPGKRESRRFVGQHMLVEGDLMSARAFPDAIAYGGWPIDTHPPEGIDRPDQVACVQTPVPYLFEIPLRSCVSRNITNLMFAGRNISATHVAFASTRVMATCALIGEGVGVAAVHAVREGLSPQALSGKPEVMDKIQQHLLREDVFLIGVKERGECNHATSARITASSEQSDAPACNVISGQNRRAGTERGVRPERLIAGTHRWASDPAHGLPAWLEVRWDAAVEIRRVELTFDTGLQRYLTLTNCDSYHKRMTWKAQPETVKAFVIEIETPEGWQEIERVNDNWKRRYQKDWPEAYRSQALRIKVTETNGIDHARIIRLAVY